MSSTVPRAKLSTLNAAGTRRMRAISCAAAYSGLMIMSRPISRRRIGASRKYSGLRTRATVCLAPSFFAINEQTRFTSSSAVAAMTRSAQALSRATGSNEASMPRSGTIAASLWFQQSHSGDTFMMKLMWKWGLPITTARAYSAIL